MPEWVLDAPELDPDTKRVFGPEHPDTLRARTALARWSEMAAEP